MRFRRFSRTRRPKQRLRWIEGISQTINAAGKYTRFFVGNKALVPATPLTDIIAQQQVESELDGNGTVVRIVGDFWLYWNPDLVTDGFWIGAPAMIWLGIRTIDQPPAGQEVAWDPSDANAQDANWMWLQTVMMKTQFIQDSANFVETSAHTYVNAQQVNRVHVDIKTRRRLTQNTAVSLYGCGAFETADGEYGSDTPGMHTKAVCLTGNLRVLCKLN